MPKQPRKTKTLDPRAALPSLRWWRQARQLSVAKVVTELAAREVFVTRQAVYHWEGNGAPCSLLTTRALAEILSTTVEALRAAPPEVKA